MTSTAPDGHPLLAVDGLTVAYGEGSAQVVAVDDASFVIERGERVGLVGESGSGKSTLAMSLMRLLPPSASELAGDVRLDGVSVRSMNSEQLREARGTKAGMVFQDPRTSFDPLTTIGGHLSLGLRSHGTRDRATIKRRSIEALGSAGMPEPESQLDRYPHEMSGGMRQRSLIALGLENEPQLLIADEPTTALDVTIQAQILELFETIGEPGQREDMGLLIVSHNLGLIRQLCHRVIVMYGGKIVEDSPVDELFANPRHPYSLALRDATPRLSERRGVVQPIPGQPVDITQLPAGCSFEPRCEFRLERCAHEVPPLRSTSGSVRVACWLEDVPVVVGRSGDAPDVASTPATDSIDRSPDDVAGEALVEVRGLTKVYRVRRPGHGFLARRSELAALSGIDLDLVSGETVAVVGESGSGKSTLAHILLGLNKPTAGGVTINGESPHQRSSTVRREQWIQAVFQDPHGSLNPYMSVGDIVAEPLVNLGMPASERRARVDQLLADVRLPTALVERRPQQISGGQAQRVAIARALSADPHLIVLDEPTASLDVSIQTHVVSLLRDLQRERGLTYLFVSHDLVAVRELATRIAVMYLGRLVEVAPWESFFDGPMHPYSVALLSAVPSIDRLGDDRIVLRGEPPSPLDVPAGCPFHDRCPVAQDRCSVDVPALADVDGHQVACHYPGSLTAIESLPTKRAVRPNGAP